MSHQEDSFDNSTIITTTNYESQTELQTNDIQLDTVIRTNNIESNTSTSTNHNDVNNSLQEPSLICISTSYTTSPNVVSALNDHLILGTSPTLTPRTPSQPLLTTSNACDATCTTPSSPISLDREQTSIRPKSPSSSNEGKSSSTFDRRLSDARLFRLEKDSKSGVNQSVISLKTPMSSHSKNKSTDNFRIRTCFGILELGRVKLCNLLSLMVNLLAFVILTVFIVGGYAGQTKIQELVSDDLGPITELNRIEMISACRASAFSNFNPIISANYSNQYNVSLQKFLTNVELILERIPYETYYNVVRNISFEDMRTVKAMILESKVLSYVKEGNYTMAMATLESPQYKYYLEGFKEELQPLVDYVHETKVKLQKLTMTVMTVCLVVIVVSIVIVIPTVIASLAMSFRKDSSNIKKLKKIKTYLLKDTMKDAKARSQFKNFCKQELSLDNYQLLEKINDFKVLCDKCIDIQVYLFDQSDTSVSDVGSEQSATTSGTENSTSKKKKKKMYTEKDYIAIEKKKYEIAFEIYTDYLDVRGDKSVNINKQLADRVKHSLDFFATGQSEQLPENLFDQVESEICLLLLDTHRRFITSLENQKQNKMELLTKLKLSQKTQVKQQ
ncbi:hypothetical protein FDP41_008207 [Naegleria fowleri]|uniref:RGS domain-containing protein n=1 Tax=Naegleria fowleri TaxID=5763 RepID=A0A6A5B3B7_NAEFO|nr:uncharacterized protein FDP41_008207 [Naegleria fowleri]KAF0973503.1 hypothetical protein FDP41_008207 [Naegleria fowleri]